MLQHQRRELAPGVFQALFTPLRIALLIGVVLACGLAIHLLSVTTC